MQKESDRIASGKMEQKWEGNIKGPFLPWNMRETEKVPTGNEASYPVGIKHVATTCATPPEDINAEQSPKRKKKKKLKKK